MGDYVFRVTAEAWEFEQIHRLNYRTFVGEIPRHRTNTERGLVDRFHGQNTYINALRWGEVVSMVALRGRRPFSLDAIRGDRDSCLPPGRRVCEMWLLAREAFAAGAGRPLERGR